MELTFISYQEWCIFFFVLALQRHAHSGMFQLALCALWNATISDYSMQVVIHSHVELNSTLAHSENNGTSFVIKKSPECAMGNLHTKHHVHTMCP